MCIVFFIIDVVANGAVEGRGDGSVSFGEGGEEFLVGCPVVMRFGAHFLLNVSSEDVSDLDLDLGLGLEEALTN